MEATADINKLTSNRIEFDETFIVLVGTEDNQKRFTVYRDVLTQRSGLFKAARSARWATDPSKPVSLEDDDPEVFSTYLHCVYFNEVVLPKASDLHPFEICEQEVHQDFEALVSTYVLADKLRDPITANIVTDEILRVCHETHRIPSAKAVTIAYESTTKEDVLRLLLRDIFTQHSNSLPPDSDTPWHTEFLQEMVNELLRKPSRRLHDLDSTRTKAQRGLYHQKTSTAAQSQETPATLDEGPLVKTEPVDVDHDYLFDDYSGRARFDAQSIEHHRLIERARRDAEYVEMFT